MQANSESPIAITNSLISQVHAAIFPDHGPEAGRWRNQNVTVGSARTPDWSQLEELMHRLERLYRPLTLDLATLRH